MDRMDDALDPDDPRVMLPELSPESSTRFSGAHAPATMSRALMISGSVGRSTTSWPNSDA
jgi:hypothetical protein